jgi:glycosyltransferase involved in cell wall biosynthesis
LDTVLDAAKLLQDAGVDVLIRFVGGGVSKPGLVKRASTERIGNVRFDDPVPKKQVPEILHTSDAFVINTRKDGVSKSWMSFNKIYEYLAASRPIVFGCCTDSDPVREAGAGISVEADNPAELARGIGFLASRSPEQLREYGARGRRYIEENYGIPTLVDRFEASITEISDQRRSSQLEAAAPAEAG